MTCLNSTFARRLLIEIGFIDTSNPPLSRHQSMMWPASHKKGKSPANTTLDLPPQQIRGFLLHRTAHTLRSFTSIRDFSQDDEPRSQMERPVPDVADAAKGASELLSLVRRRI